MLQILMPMGGLGSRFSRVGYGNPKPLIPVDGVPMFQKAISSLEGINVNKQTNFVIRQEMQDKFQFKDRIMEFLPDARVVVIKKLTRGAVETCLKAEEFIEEGEPLIIMDCDLWFSSQEYNKMVNQVIKKESNIDGGLLTFESNSPRYSYVKSKNGIATETAEKKIISHRAITGAYFFSKAKTFFDAAKDILKTPLSDEVPEYYISFVVNSVIQKGLRIKVANVDEFYSFGTPEELEIYEEEHRR